MQKIMSRPWPTIIITTNTQYMVCPKSNVSESIKNKEGTFTKHKFSMVIASIFNSFQCHKHEGKNDELFPNSVGFSPYRLIKSITITVIIIELNSRNFPELHRNFYCC